MDPGASWRALTGSRCGLRRLPELSGIREAGTGTHSSSGNRNLTISGFSDSETSERCSETSGSGPSTLLRLPQIGADIDIRRVSQQGPPRSLLPLQHGSSPRPACAVRGADPRVSEPQPQSGLLVVPARRCGRRLLANDCGVVPTMTECICECRAAPGSDCHSVRIGHGSDRLGGEHHRFDG